MRKIHLLFALVLVLPAGPSPIAAASSTTAEVAAAAERRAELGLEADTAVVRELMGSSRDVGTQHWGIPMTAEEEAAVDLVGRMRFANQVDRTAMPYLRSLPTFGGTYIDQVHGGGLVVLLTERSAAVEQKVADLLPEGERGVTFVEVAHTEVSLIEALDQARSTWSSYAPHVQLLAADLDTRGNRIVVRVALEDLATAETSAREVERKVQVPVGVAAGEAEIDVDCPNRDHCHDPMWSGVRLYQGVVDSVPECTMGFHISIAGNEHFVVAGHCGFLSVSNEWIHPPLGVVATEGPSLYREDGQDIRYMNNFADAQASDNIFACCTDIVGMGSPVLSELLCASLGRTQAIRCGTVLVTWGQHFSGTGGFNVWSARLNITTNPGDSGSPVYRVVSSNENQAVALGAINTADGRFARLDTSLDDWNASVVR